MATENQQAVPGTGGSIDEVVAEHAGILALDDEDTRDPGEAASEAEEAEDESEYEDAGEGDDSKESDEDNSEDDADDDDDSDEDADDEDGDEEDDGDEDDDAEPTFKVKVNGEEIEVPQSELIAGYSRQADYTRKTQTLQKERESFQEESESVRAEREQYATLLGKLKEQVESGGEDEPNWDELYARDPDEWLRQREFWRTRRERAQAIEAEQDRVRQQQETERRAKVQERLAEEKDKLTAAVPEWANEEVRDKEMRQIAHYAHETIGFGADELEQIYDSRAVLALRKAMLYDDLASKRAKVKPGKGKGKGKRPKTSAPGNASEPASKGKVSRQQKAARQRLAENGGLHDAADVLVDYLD